ncbi:MAG: 4-hydroxy-3-methylbut-2-enyl diphosphate reductase [Phycisphaerales bacterium]|nr:4-hydroxy-3-methylbut-2-enyl diphosphate reductase [Phycisphaerales bacterium]
MRLLLANPRCHCAGVDRAVKIVQSILERFGPPLYVRREIVHNRHVVDELRLQGVVFVDELSEVPREARVIFSAHGVAPSVYEEARERGLLVIDATCPLVHKVHAEAKRFISQGYHVILIGRAGHEEVVGTLGQAAGCIHLIEDIDQARKAAIDLQRQVAVLTQTTLSVDDAQAIIVVLRERFGEIALPTRDDICYATQNRQNAVKALCDRGIDLLLVVGSRNSSNANRLIEVGRVRGVRGMLIDGPEDLRNEWFEGAKAVGITGGASTPEKRVQTVVDRLQGLGGAAVEICSVADENTVFPLPEIR